VATRDNAFAVNVLIDSTALPAPTLVPRQSEVFVAVANIDDLGEWLMALGGEVHVSPEFQGLQIWTLHTSTPKRSNGTSVPIRVSVAVVSDEAVLDYVRAAVIQNHSTPTSSDGGR